MRWGWGKEPPQGAHQIYFVMSMFILKSEGCRCESICEFNSFF